MSESIAEGKFMIAIIVWHINRNIIVSLMAPQNYLTNMKKRFFIPLFSIHPGQYFPWKMLEI